MSKTLLKSLISIVLRANPSAMHGERFACYEWETTWTYRALVRSAGGQETDLIFDRSIGVVVSLSRDGDELTKWN